MASLVKKYKRKYRRNPDDAPASSSGDGILGGEIIELVVPAVGAFAATRIATRIAATQIAKRYPRAAKHAGVLASAGGFVAAWQLAHRWSVIEKYHEPIVIGAGVAAIQTVIQTYLPKLGWTVSDASPNVAMAARRQQAQVPAQQAQRSLPSMQDEDPDYESIDEGGWFSYNDARSPGRYTDGGPHPKQQAAQPVPDDDVASAEDEAVFDALLNEGDMQSAGIFGG